MKPKVSIVIPVFNAEKTIKNCIDSLLLQTLHEIELIAVDDKSTDGTMLILREYAELDNRFILLENQENSGTLLSRKKGVAEATGEYIMFADNDDWYELNACEELYNRIREEDVDILLYGTRGIKLNNNVSDAQLEKYNKSVIPKEEHYVGETCILTVNDADRLWNKIVKTEICKEAYDNSEDVRLTHAEDTYAAWLIHYYAKSLATTNKIFYNHTMGLGLTTNHMDIENYDCWCKCRKLCEDSIGRFIRRHEITADIEAYYEKKQKAWVTYCFNAFHNKLLKDDKARGLEILLNYFGMERVADAIERNSNSLESRNEKLENRIRKIEKSRSYKFSRGLARIVR